MVTSTATTPDEYVGSLPDERREMVSAIRDTINANLPPGYEEGMAYGMIGWYVPLETFPDTYNGQPLSLAGLASQKQYVALYLNSVYSDPKTDAWFRDRHAVSGKRLDMGKSCVRFRRLEEIPLDVIGEAIARVHLGAFVRHVERVRGAARKARRSAG